MAVTAAPLPVSRLPDAIGRFRPRRVLGRGGQGVVFLAHDPKLDRDVALKTLPRGQRASERFISEARNVAKLDHPGIVPLYEFEFAGTSPYLVYQFAEGQPLAARIGTEPLPIHETLTLVCAVLDAIGYAHARGILHRDLSPANILVDPQGRPRILDFGVSTVLTTDTQGGDLVGTVNYLPPECIAKGTLGPFSDLYSLGVILHELLTGRRLFTADTSMAVIYKIVHEHVLPPSAFNRAIDPALDAIVMQAIARDTAQRFATAEAMKDALQAYLNPVSADAPKGGGQSGAIDFLMRRMARKPDFPAVSALVAEINTKSGRPESDDVNELANVILKDYALTTKLLKLVNSAVYGQYGGTITTVSRAVLILGFDAIRTAALSIAIFEHLKSGSQADALKDAACGAFLSGMIAKELGRTTIGVDAEEAFIGAMFHRLGRHLAIYYFPEEFGEITTLVGQRGITETAAAREVLGTTFADFGLAVARQWNFPDKLLLAMTPQREGRIAAPTSPGQKNAQVAAFANEIAETVAGARDDAELNQRLKRLGERYEPCLKTEVGQLRETVLKSVDATRNYANLLTVDARSSGFFKKVVRRLTGDPAADKTLPATAASALAGTVTRGPVDDGADDEDRRSVLVNAVTEITNALLEQTPVNQIFGMVLEAFYRGVDFTRVLLLLRDPKRHAMQARLGLGADAQDVIPGFGFKCDDTTDIFNEAVRKCRESIVLDANAPQYQGRIPGWCRTLTDPHSVLLFPLVANKQCIGLIYADKVGEQVSFSVQELKLLNTLIKQASLAFSQRR
ncbi:MAG: HDOD domain-containing protein [Gammaproteobacteria bacterium]